MAVVTGGLLAGAIWIGSLHGIAKLGRQRTTIAESASCSSTEEKVLDSGTSGTKTHERHNRDDRANSSVHVIFLHMHSERIR